MKNLGLLNPAYKTEDGIIFECGNIDDHTKIMRAIKNSASSEDVIKTLNESGIPFRMYKEIENLQ